MDACIVTGSTGFLGSHVVEALARSGRRVLALTRRPVASNHANVIPVTASLENLHPLRAAIAEHGCQAILHFAAAIPTASTPLNMETACATNVLGTARLLDLLEELDGQVFVYASSIAVYAPSDQPLREDSRIAPDTPYAVSKYCGELCGEAASARTGIRAVALRISAPYGPGMDLRTVMPLFLRLASSGATPKYHGSGIRTQNFVHAEDVAQACLLAMKNGHGAYNIGGQEANMRQLAGLALEICGRSASEAQASGAPDPQEQRAWRLDLSRAKSELGYAPSCALDCGMRTVAAAMASPRQTWWREP